MSDAWFVYVLECGDGSLYTGVATDVQRRLEAHAAGRGAKYTRGRGPLALVATSCALDKSEAHRVERRVKMLPRGAKLKAVEDARP